MRNGKNATSTQQANPLKLRLAFVLISVLIHTVVLFAIRFEQVPVNSASDYRPLRVILTPPKAKSKPEPDPAPRLKTTKTVKARVVQPKAHQTARKEGPLPTAPQNWNHIAETHIQLEMAREQQAQRIKAQQWRTAPSVLWGPVPDFFAQQPALAEYPTAFSGDGAVVLRIKVKTFTGLGIALGQSCFLGTLLLDEADYKKMARTGRYLSPFSMLTCEF